jgi:aminopeptidase N
MKKYILLLLFFNISFAQNFTHRDSLQGGFQFERACYDVQRYDLNIKIDPENKSIVGYNDISFKIVEKTNKIQIDLFENMTVDSIIFNNNKMKYKRDEIAVYIMFPNTLEVNSQANIRFFYSGKPTIAKRAPWDGGFVFTQDSKGKAFIATAVQGEGASMWYPVKDSQIDEPDKGATIKVAVPNGLMNVSNGRFMGSQDLKNGYTRWDWEVKNPINNYNIAINIADYVHLHDNHKGLDLDYYVLRENEEKAKAHFQVVKPMMDCFQSKFGEYPFKDDGFKLVETPYLGMEHQSAVAYGNHYQMGYLGKDLSNTGVGLLFDYLVIHESGHEWFGNSITSIDIADMWIHEGFTMYTEFVFVECLYGYDKAMEYAYGMQNNVKNDKPIISAYGVNSKGSGDMYPKGSLLLNTIRHIVNNDTKWWQMLLKYSQIFRHKIIDNKAVIDYFSKEAGINLTSVFNQYLLHTSIPELQFRKIKKHIEYRWQTAEPNFEMPVDVLISGKEIRLQATNVWNKLDAKNVTIKDIQLLKKQFYIH